MQRPSRSLLSAVLVLPGLGSLPLAQEPDLYWSDYDGDGRQDAFVVGPGREGRLLRSVDGGALADVTAAAGLTRTDGVRFAVWSDYDGDGRRDLFLGTREGPSRLYRALAGGAFEEVAAAAGLLHAGADLHADFVDYDADGRPDLYVQMRQGGRLYHNAGDGFFELVPLDVPASPVDGALPGASSRAPLPSKQGMPAEPVAAATSRGAHGPDSTRRSSGRVPAAPPTSGVEEAVAFPACVRAIRDQDGGCLLASSTPTLGQLYPITSDLYVDATSGSVGSGRRARARAWTSLATSPWTSSTSTGTRRSTGTSTSSPGAIS